MPARVPSHEAEDALRQAGYFPLEIYPGRVEAPWQARHSCGWDGAITLRTVRSGGTACKPCRYANIVLDRVAKAAETDAEVLKSLGWTPLAPYAGRSQGWLARHRCGHETEVHVGRLEQGVEQCFALFIRASRAFTDIQLRGRIHPVSPGCRIRAHRAVPWRGQTMALQTCLWCGSSGDRKFDQAWDRGMPSMRQCHLGPSAPSTQ